MGLIPFSGLSSSTTLIYQVQDFPARQNRPRSKNVQKTPVLSYARKLIGLRVQRFRVYAPQVCDGINSDVLQITGNALPDAGDLFQFRFSGFAHDCEFDIWNLFVIVPE